MLKSFLAAVLLSASVERFFVSWRRLCKAEAVSLSVTPHGATLYQLYQHVFLLRREEAISYSSISNGLFQAAGRSPCILPSCLSWLASQCWADAGDDRCQSSLSSCIQTSPLLACPPACPGKVTGRSPGPGQLQPGWRGTYYPDQCNPPICLLFSHHLNIFVYNIL